ncbi:hypothetical protein [Mesobacterium pallidum]|uniref:hypothetical protein n=1 Tax=Mesobacterium pallidum TaxID=2872037 RepID=UPI001EE22B91|nr:hypothetical protein [Mesobacterium pallidum]
MTANELDEILTCHWPAVLRRVMADGSDEWVQGFAKSIARQGKRPGWRPTPKQAWIMRRLVADLAAGAGDTLELIER